MVSDDAVFQAKPTIFSCGDARLDESLIATIDTSYRMQVRLVTTHLDLGLEAHHIIIF
jgi:hypothetical protein